MAADSLLDGIAKDQAELERAVKLQQRAAQAGFDWDRPGPVLDKLQEEIAELQAAMATGEREPVEDELGDLMFAAVNLARKLEIDPALALHRANGKFERRFRALERLAGTTARLRQLSLDEMEILWREVKKREAIDE